jgi:hypothetical protein
VLDLGSTGVLGLAAVALTVAGTAMTVVALVTVRQGRRVVAAAREQSAEAARLTEAVERQIEALVAQTRATEGQVYLLAKHGEAAEAQARSIGDYTAEVARQVAATEQQAMATNRAMLEVQKSREASCRPHLILSPSERRGEKRYVRVQTVGPGPAVNCRAFYLERPNDDGLSVEPSLFVTRPFDIADGEEAEVRVRPVAGDAAAIFDLAPSPSEATLCCVCDDLLRGKYRFFSHTPIVDHWRPGEAPVPAWAAPI